MGLQIEAGKPHQKTIRISTKGEKDQKGKQAKKK
jgi:hypothetical protein